LKLRKKNRVRDHEKISSHFNGHFTIISFKRNILMVEMGWSLFHYSLDWEVTQKQFSQCMISEDGG
jgi:hypothetical protein